VPILEDDPYSELRYEGTMVPSLKALDSGESVLHLGTFSKILFPGLRLGWLVAPRPVVRRLALLKQAMDLHSNTPGQYVLERFIRRSLINEHLHLLRRAYTQRRNAMEEALRRHAGAGVTWQKPAGGFYFWCRLPDGVERSRLMAQAAERGVAFLPGWACFAEEPGESCVRLNFSYPPPHQLAAGVDRLMAAVRAATVPAGRRLAAAAGTRPIV
jgi:DNA-binding transcriptional MocR family regulator